MRNSFTLVSVVEFGFAGVQTALDAEDILHLCEEGSVEQKECVWERRGNLWGVSR